MYIYTCNTIIKIEVDPQFLPYTKHYTNMATKTYPTTETPLIGAKYTHA